MRTSSVEGQKLKFQNNMGQKKKKLSSKEGQMIKYQREEGQKIPLWKARVGLFPTYSGVDACS
jgi:hypothetical protein